MVVGKPLFIPKQINVISLFFPPFKLSIYFFNFCSPFTVSSPSEMKTIVIEAFFYSSSNLSYNNLKAANILVIPPPCFLISYSKKGCYSSLAFWLKVISKLACGAIDWFQNFAMSFQNDPMLPDASMRPIITLSLEPSTI